MHIVSLYIYYMLMASLEMFFFFFFSSRRRHTRLQGDWSSDVCSSDLKSPIAGRIHLFKAASMLEASLIGSLSRVCTHWRYVLAWARKVVSPRTTRLNRSSEFAPDFSTISRAFRSTSEDGGFGFPLLSKPTG